MPWQFLCRLSTKKHGQIEANPLPLGARARAFFVKTSPTGLRCRSCSVTAAAFAAARFLFVPSELPPLWVPVLRSALLCGLLFLSTLNYRTTNCPRIAAPCYVGVECPAALFYISAQPKPSIFGWLFITHILLVINGELGQFALHHQHFMWLPCVCFSCRASLQ